MQRDFRSFTHGLKLCFRLLLAILAMIVLYLCFLIRSPQDTLSGQKAVLSASPLELADGVEVVPPEHPARSASVMAATTPVLTNLLNFIFCLPSAVDRYKKISFIL